MCDNSWHISSVLMAEVYLSIHMEALPEGGFLATSEDLPGLVAQGRTVA
jgi:predicted RNase H-like HicB family nuclease